MEKKPLFLKHKTTSIIIKPWIKIVSLFGVGLLPCPECGAPMIFHFWPLALALTVTQIVKQRKLKALNQPEE